MAKKFVYTKNKMAKNNAKNVYTKNKMAPNGLIKCIYKNKNDTKWSQKMYIQNISIARLLPRILVYQPRSKYFCPTFTRFPAYKLEHFFLFRRDSQHKILCFFTSNTWSASHFFHCISPPKRKGEEPIRTPPSFFLRCCSPSSTRSSRTQF